MLSAALFPSAHRPHPSVRIVCVMQHLVMSSLAPSDAASASDASAARIDAIPLSSPPPVAVRQSAAADANSTAGSTAFVPTATEFPPPDSSASTPPADAHLPAAAAPAVPAAAAVFPAGQVTPFTTSPSLSSQRSSKMSDGDIKLPPPVVTGSGETDEEAADDHDAPAEDADLHTGEESAHEDTAGREPGQLAHTYFAHEATSFAHVLMILMFARVCYL
jgi:hypothetical protein